MRFPLVIGKSADRQCGECTECCTAMGVHEIQKPVWETCQHVTSNGCGCYETRPNSCKTFYCLWQAGFLEGDERRRPDRLGVMFTAPKNDFIDTIVDCWELRPGALDDPRVQYLIDAIVQKWCVYLRFYKSSRRRLIGPAELMRQITEIQEIG